MAGFTFTLEQEDGTPADATTFRTVVPTRRAGDTIPLGTRTLRVIAIRDDDADQPPALVVQSAWHLSFFRQQFPTLTAALHQLPARHAPPGGQSRLVPPELPGHCQRGTLRIGWSSASLSAHEFCCATREPNSTWERTASRNASSLGRPASSSASMYSATKRSRCSSVIFRWRWTSITC
jgi:hypothetical protein